MVSVQLREQPALAKLTAGKRRDCGRSLFSHLGEDFLGASKLGCIPSVLPIPGLISPNRRHRMGDIPWHCALSGRANKERRKKELPWWSFLWFPGSCSPHLTPAGRDCESYTGLQIPAALNPGAAATALANGAAGAACMHGFIVPRRLFMQSSWVPFFFLLSLQILTMSLCGNNIIATNLETVWFLRF